MRNGITPMFPFQVDTDDSDYILIIGKADLVKQNLTNLILTAPGERIMDPLFGVGIRRFLFENKTDTLTTAIKNLISTQAKKYMPFITIDQVYFASDDENPNYLGITISYTINALNIRDNINLDFILDRLSNR